MTERKAKATARTGGLWWFPSLKIETWGTRSFVEAPAKSNRGSFVAELLRMTTLV
jgi:hypothetical protein